MITEYDKWLLPREDKKYDPDQQRDILNDWTVRELLCLLPAYEKTKNFSEDLEDIDKEELITVIIDGAHFTS